MKLRWYDRILISLGGLVLTAAGVCIVLAGGGVIKPEWFALDNWIGSGWQWTPLIVLAGLLVAAWGVWLFLLPFIRQRTRNGKYYIVQGGNGDEDGVQISMQALDHLVHKALSVWPEILTANVKIGGQEDAMRITLRTTLQSNVRIPELIGDVRAEIKQYVEECAGVKVASVKVIIESTKDTRAQQKEAKEPAAEATHTAQTPEEVVLELEGGRKPVPERMPVATRVTAPPVPQAAVSDAPAYVPPPVAGEPMPEPDPDPEPVVSVVQPESEVDFGPDEPLPVTLSGDAFPFPEEGGETADEDVGDAPEHTEEETPDA